MRKINTLLCTFIALFVLSTCDRCPGCSPKKVPPPQVVLPPSPPAPILPPAPAEPPAAVPQEDAGVAPQADEEPKPKVKKRSKKTKKPKQRMVETESLPAAPQPIILPPPPEVVEETPPPPPMPSAGSLRVRFIDNMGEQFKLESYRVLLDGKEILVGSAPQTVISRPLDAGPHAIDVEVNYRGNDPVFEYFNEYKFHLEDGVPGGVSVQVDGNDRVSVDIEGYLTGTCLARIEDRPSLKVNVAKNVPPITTAANEGQTSADQPY